MSNNISLLLILILSALTAFSVYEMQSEIYNLKAQLHTTTPTKTSTPNP